LPTDPFSSSHDAKKLYIAVQKDIQNFGCTFVLARQFLKKDKKEKAPKKEKKQKKSGKRGGKKMKKRNSPAPTDAPTTSMPARVQSTPSPTASPTDAPTPATDAPTQTPTTTSPAVPTTPTIPTAGTSPSPYVRVTFIGDGECVDASGTTFGDSCDNTVNLSQGEMYYTEGQCKQAAISTEGALGYQYESLNWNGQIYQRCKILVPDISKAFCPSGFDYYTGTVGTGFPVKTQRNSGPQTVITQKCYSLQDTPVLPSVKLVGEGPCLDSNGASYHYCYQNVARGL